MHNIENNLMLCLAICGQDGLISKSEEECLFKIFSENCSLTRPQFEAIVNMFFESEDSLEQLLRKSSDRSALLKWAKEAAQVDGLDFRENIALQKCSQLIE